MKRIQMGQILTILATLGTVGINILANLLPLNGLNTGEISDQFRIYFVPAGYVFSIWAVIYLGLLVYTIFQALPTQADNQLLKRIGPWYWGSSLANIAWLFLWHYEIFNWTLPVMALILLSLLAINRNLSEAEGLSKWTVKLPFSIYLGWISVATIANFSQWLHFLEWNGWGISPEVWAVIMLGVASGLGLLMTWLRSDTAYALVLMWAFIGITVSQAGAAPVVLASWIGVTLLGVSILGNILKTKRFYS